MKFLDRKEVAEKISVHPQQVYRLAKSDESFPKPARVSGRCVRWLESEIETWMQSQFIKENENES